MVSSSTIKECDSSRTLPISTGPVQSPKPGGAALNDSTNLQDSNSLPSGGNPSSNNASGAITTSSATTTITVTASSTTFYIKVHLQDDLLVQNIQKQLNEWCSAMILSAESLGGDAMITSKQIQNQAQAMIRAALMAKAVVNNTNLEQIGIRFMSPKGISSRSQREARSIVQTNLQMALLASGSSKVDKDGKPVQPTSGQKKYQINLQARALIFAYTKANEEATLNKANEAQNKARLRMIEYRKRKRDELKRIIEVPDDERTPEDIATLNKANEARLRKNDKNRLQYNDKRNKRNKRKRDELERIKEIPDDERTSEDIATLNKAKEAQLRHNDNQNKRNKTSRDELKRIIGVPDDERTPEDIATLNKAKEAQLLKNENQIKRRKTSRDELERIKDVPDDERTPEDIATLNKANSARLRENENRNKRHKTRKENSYIDGEGVAKENFKENDVPQGMNIIESTIPGLMMFRRIITDILSSDKELTVKEIAEKAVSQVEEYGGRFLEKKPDHNSDRYFPINHERAAERAVQRVKTVKHRLDFKARWKKYMNDIEQANPLPIDGSIPPPEDLAKEYVDAKEKNDCKRLDQVIEKMKKYLLQLLFRQYSSNNEDSPNQYYSHICPQKPALMQQTIGGLLALIPYSGMRARQWHQVHRPQVPLPPGLRRIGDSMDLLWCHTHLPDSLHHGISNAMTRGYMDNQHYVGQTQSNSVYLHLKKVNPNDPNWGLPPHGLHVLQSFRVTQHPVEPDFILEIKLGRTGLFDPATEIWLVMIDGHVCNFRL